MYLIVLPVYLKLNGVYQYCGYVQWVYPDTITSMQYYPAESGPSFTSDPGDTTLVIQPPNGSTGLYGGNHSSDSNNTENHAPMGVVKGVATPPPPEGPLHAGDEALEESGTVLCTFRWSNSR